MGAFDDLIPASGGAFDDLIPQKKASGNWLENVRDFGVRFIDNERAGLAARRERIRQEDFERDNAGLGLTGGTPPPSARSTADLWAPEPITMSGLNWARDVALGGVKGVASTGVKLPLAVQGIALDATGTRKFAENIGIRNRDALQVVSDFSNWVNSYKSEAGQARDKQFAATRGMADTLLEMGANPGMIVDQVAEAMPGTFAIGATAGTAIAQAMPYLVKQAAARGLTGKAAEQFIGAAATKIAMVAAPASEGAQSALDIAGTAQQAGVPLSKYGLPALTAGAITGAIGFGSNKLGARFGFGDLETDIALRGTAGSFKTGPMGWAKRIGGEALKEGAVEEGPQSSQEAIAENIAMGRPWDQGLGKAAAVGAVTGAAMGGGHAALTRGTDMLLPEPGLAPGLAPGVAPAMAGVAPGLAPGLAPRAGDNVLAPTREGEPTPAEKALLQPVNLTALDRVNEIDGELARVAQRQADLVPDKGYGPMFDQERAELAQSHASLSAERGAIAATWPKSAPGAPTSFSTEAGVRINAQYALMDAGDLVTSHDVGLRQNPLYPQELQPRDRSRQASELQVSSIVQKLDPARLGVSADAANGAPIVGADGLVESGNARAIALKRVYQANGQKAVDYKQFIKDNAAQFGVDPAAVDGMARPVLVRVRQTPVNRAEFARQANASTVQRMSPSEQALSDASRLTSLEGLNPDEAGDFANSHDFIRQFMGMLPVTEQNDMVESDGKLSTYGYRRIQNAVMAKAYGDSPTLRRMTESMDDNLRNVSKALLRVAPTIAEARGNVAAGTLHDADIAPHLLQAVEGLSALKERGWTVQQELGQQDLTGPKYSEESAALLTLLSDNIRSPRKIAEFFQRYYDALAAAGNPKQEAMFDAGAPPSRMGLIAAAQGEPDANIASNAKRGDDRAGAQPAAQSGRQPEDAARRGGSDQGNGAAAAAAGTESRLSRAAGKAPRWVAFPKESGTLGIPRPQMPQIKSDSRGALVNFLKARGTASENVEIPPGDLKPTQAEYSPGKVEAYQKATGLGERSVLVSSDNYILDGHHQWLAHVEANAPVKAIKFDAPMRELLAQVEEFPGAQSSRTKAAQEFKDALADLADMATRHLRPGFVMLNDQERAQMLPTLVKLFEAAIKVVGSDLKAAIAYVKAALRDNATLKKYVNRIDDATFREAALQAIDKGEAASSGGLFAAAPAVSKPAKPADDKLILADNAPPKDKPVVLVYGGSFNPPHVMHVEIARQAKGLLEDAGYKVQTVVVSPSPQSLMVAKSGEGATSLTERTAMAKKAFAAMEGATVTPAPSLAAAKITGKLKRTQQADWARAKYPDATVVSLTGEDSAPGKPPGFPSVYSGDTGTSHQGYYYLAMGRDEGEGGVSSSKVRALIEAGKPVPANMAHPDVVRHFKALTGASAEIAIDGRLYDVNAPDLGMEPKPETLAKGDPLLTDTDKLHEVTFEGEVMPRETMRDMIVSRLFNQLVPVQDRAPIAYIMGGGGASGKGTIKRLLQSTGQIPSSGLLELDPDEIKLEIPEYKQIVAAGDWRAANVVHEESSAIAKRVLAKAISKPQYDLVYDVTLGDPVKAAVSLRALKAAGYEINLYGVVVDPVLALARADARARTTGRYVPLDQLLKAHKGFVAGFPGYLALVDRAALFENSDTTPTLIAQRTATGGLEVLAEKAYNQVTERAGSINETGQTIAQAVPGSARVESAAIHTSGRHAQGSPREGRGRDREGQGQDLPSENLPRARNADQGQVNADVQPGPSSPQGQGAGSVPATGGKGRARQLPERSGQSSLFGDGGPDNAGPAAGPVGQTGTGGVRGPDENGLGAEQGTGDGRPAGVPAGRDIPAKTGRNYEFGPADLTYEGSWQKKATQNVEAVELLKQLQAANQGEGRQATREEQAVLARFIGWGSSEIANTLFGPKLDRQIEAISAYDLAADYFKERGDRPMSQFDRGYRQAAQVLNAKAGKNAGYYPSITRDMLDKARPDPATRRWIDLRNRLQAALTEKELAEASRSTQYAHFTSRAVVQSMWAAMDRMGFKGGAILEPGAGIGVFPGLMSPALATNSIYTGIEFDTITGGILKQLFPDERILVESFVDSRLPKNFYDVAIGNPPFSPSKVLGDPEYAKQALALHDYFFAKSIDRVKPGGLVMYISSRYTMDKLDDKARAYLAERADLVGAIRLPQTAFTKNAGTEVVTDVIFLRKKVPGQTFEHGQAWLKTDQVATPDGLATINEYFVAHPEMVLGTHAMQGSMRKENEYTVLPLAGNIEDLFAAAVQKLPADIYQAQRGSGAEEAKVREIDWNPTAKKEGNYYVNDAGVLMVREGGVGVRAEKVSLNDAPMVKAFVGLRDALKLAHYDQLHDGDWETSLRALKSAYDKFVKQHGQIQQYTSKVVKTKAIDEETGEAYTDEEVRRTHTLLKKLEDDPDYTLFAALETLNDDTGKITPSAFLSERVLGKPAPATINTPSDALLATLNDVGHVDMAAVAQRIGLSEADTIEALGSAVYQNPEGGWEMADEYLSGNVKRKLEHARTAASSDKRYERNVSALEVVQPAALPPSKIGVTLGMNWIPGTDYQEFLQETAGVSARVAWNERTKQWIVEELSGGTTERARTDWGTGRRNATQLLEHALTGRAIRIESTVGTGKDQKTVFDASATEGANAKLQALRNEFAKWIWRDPVRTDRLVQAYNDRFNTTVPRAFDGRHLTLPGASKRWNVFPHVKRGAWRIVQSGNTYLAHAVGSGKTFEMVISAMEQRRLGLVKKPMMVVPNHVLGQFASEWLDLYPTAKLMVADEHNFHMDNRRRFVSRVALSDLDGVIITHSAFKLLDLDPAFKKTMIEQQLTFMRAALEEAGGDPDKLRMIADGTNAKGEPKYRLKGSGSRDPKIKQIERQIENMEQKLLKLTSGVGKDQNVRFDELGVDFLYVDEAHEFRKLSFATNRQVKGLTPVGSDQAFDLWMKSRYLEQKTPGRSLVMASGTPITNTIAELYTVNRFMKNQDLIDRGIEDFDSWAAMFGREATALESNASGRYEPVTRFSEFANVSEMTQMFREFADVLTSDHLAQMLGDQRPRLASGSRKIVVTPETATYEAWRPELEARFDISKKWKPTREEPNNPDPIIRIIGDARLAAVDMRFIHPGLPNDPESKLNAMIDGVIAVHNKYADMQYSSKDGKIEPAKGSAQMVFSDIGMGAGVAESRGFNARAWMEKRLRDAGIPMAQVAFMSDFKKSTAKLKLFKDVNAGRVRILVGSSKGMGTGVNAQQRLIAEHHLDSPWYPADLEQREGRILRTGNKNPLVEIYAYAAKGSYDEPMWGMLARKQSFIDKALSGDANVRQIEDLDSQSQFAQIAGMVSKDPRVLKLAGLKADIAKMQRLYEDHEQQRVRFGQEYRGAGTELAWASSNLAQAERDASKVHDLSGDKFKARVGAEQYTERTAWGKALLARFQAVAATGTRDGQTVGEISGFKIDFAVHPSKDNSVYEPYLTLKLPVSYYLTGDHTASPIGVAMRASNAVADVAALPAKLRERMATARAKMDAYANRLEAPFSMAEMLAGTIAEAQSLELDLARTDLDKVGLEDTLYGEMRVGDASGNESDSVESGIVMERRPTSMAADLEAQEKWLTVEAKARGYTDIEALLDKDYQLFDKLAALWRAKHPAQAMMSVDQRRLEYKNDAQPDVFTQQLELFTASLPDESQAGPRVQAVRREAADALRVLRGTNTLLGKALSSGLAARQRVNLVGKVASTPIELATLAQVYRDPRFETFRVVFTDDAGLVVSQVGMTSRLPGSTAAVVGNDHKAYVTRLVQAAAQEGATRMWMLHNHPSGDAKPSNSDSMLTRMFAINVAKVSPAAADRKRGMKYLNMKFMGHVVIDTNQYSVIDGSGESNLHTKDFGAVEPFAGAGAFAGFKITSPDDVMGLAKRIGVDRNAVTLIALSYQNIVHSLTTLPAAVFADQVNEDPKGWNARIRKVVTRAVLAGNAYHVVAVGRDSELMLRLHGQGMTLDTVTINADGSVVSAAKSFGRGRDLLPQSRRTRLTLDTSPAFAYLREQIRPAYDSQAAAETKPQFGAQPATQTKTAAERAEAIIQDKVGRFTPLDAVTRTLTRLTGVEKVAGAAYRQATFLLDRYTPEQIKAGVMSDYGVPEAVIDQRALLQGRQRVQLRQAGALIEKLATLTRAESRVAYEWMNMDGSDPRAYVSMMHGLPEESVKVLQDVQQLIDKLSREAVALGQLDPQAYERNKFAYLRRSYVKYTDELNPGDKAKRSRAISILGDQYKGRGLSESAAMKQVENVAPEWWKRKLVEGKADKGLKGERFIRLERRAASGAGVVPLPGMTGKAKGRVLEVDYFPAGATMPAKYADWDQAGSWEVRDVKGPNLILWRDFTKDERERMGEIDEARFAIAKTLHGMIHDVEVGRYLEWLAHTQAKKEGEVIPGTVVEASERYRDTFKVGEWVRVPDTKIGGTSVAKYGKLAGRYLPGPIWNDLRQTVNGQFKPLGETYAKILSLWKKSKTALSPAVHMNNVMSNFVMMDWHDIGAGHVSKALRIMLSAKDQGQGIIGGVGNKLAGAGIADREAAQAIMDRYRDSGGDIGSWATNEVARAQLEPLLADLEKELAATNGNSVQAQVGVMAALQHAVHGRLPSALDAAKGSVPVKAIATEAGTMLDLYQAEDDVFRLAAWLKAKEDGKPDLQAGKLARTSFMDYHINAPWIQAMRNSAWPFLSYTYRAVPMLLETAGKKPHKLLKLMMLAGVLNSLGVLMGGGGDDKERKLLPEEKAGRVWGLVPKMIRMPWNDANGSPVYLDIRRFIPVGDVMDVGAGHAAVPLLPAMLPGGPLALFGEVIANRSMFTGKPITLETDTPQQQAVKMAAYLYQAFMPNLLGVPGTYATTGAVDAVKGKTDAFGREQSVAQAVASSIGIKLGSYPADVLLRNERAKASAQLMEIDKNIADLRRRRQRNTIDQKEFESGVQAERDKKDQVARKLREKMS